MPPTPQDLPVTAEILALLGKISEKFEPNNAEMKRWMAENATNPAISELLQDSTIIALRVLDTVGRLEPVNGITIAKQSGIPRGSVSKVTRRLVARKLLTSESLPNNKKEILFRTTALGRELYETHRSFDEQMERGFVRFLEHYTPDELAFIARLLQDISEASFLKLGT